MMRAIAKRFAEGGFTLSELARELNVQQDALVERLFAMERLGFIVRSEGCGESTQTQASSCRCCGCSCSSGCGETVAERAVTYTLTEKGKRLAGIKKTGSL